MATKRTRGLVLSWEDITVRFPNLLEAVKYAALLSDGEGIACIRDYAAGLDWSSEAVNAFGGTFAVIQRAKSAYTREQVKRQRDGFMRMMMELR